MQHNRKTIPGVTLLEIMLVLAIAALVVVMSIRYYLTSVTAQQANSTIAQMQAIVNAASTIVGDTGDYSVVNTASVTALMPDKTLNSAWGSAITLSGSGSTFSAEFADTPYAVCLILSSRLSADNHYDISATTCPSTGTVTYKYTYNAAV